MNKNQLVKNIISKIKNGIFVEIGTHTGVFADFMLANSNNSKLYCIDPYIKYGDYDDAINNVTGDDLYNNVYNKLKQKYGDRIIFIREFSHNALNLIPEDIDFLYIDGNHRYKYVLNDLETYYSKVKPGSYIVGDDAVDVDNSKRNSNGDVHIKWDGPNCYGNYGVIKAFNEFLDMKKIEGYIISNQYIFKKPF
jgi:predicted O-methyltransferase YrrM